VEEVSGTSPNNLIISSEFVVSLTSTRESPEDLLLESFKTCTSKVSFANLFKPIDSHGERFDKDYFYPLAYM
jgi:hypothetical protein